MTLASDSGLEIVADDLSEPTRDDFGALAQVPLAERFRRYERDLAIREMSLIRRRAKRDPQSALQSVGGTTADGCARPPAHRPLRIRSLAPASVRSRSRGVRAT
jgi:hypothetical protein